MSNHLFDGLFAGLREDASFANLQNGQKRTYGEAVDLTAHLANGLVGFGIKTGDRVAVQVPKTIEAALLYLACVRLGAVFLPLNTAYTASEVSYFIRDACASLLICDPKNTEALKPVADDTGCKLETLGVAGEDGQAQGSLMDAAMQASSVFENTVRGPQDLAAILYTSGTTGRSKGAMLSHDNLLSNGQALVDLWKFTSEDVLLHALPIFHTHGLFVAINVIILAGGSMIFLPSFDLDTVLEQLPHSTAMMGVPTFYTRLLATQRFDRDLVSHMRLFVSGSAPMLADTHVEFEARTGHRVLERYGMTETNMTTSNPYDGERQAGTVGFPLPKVDIRICDSSGEILPMGEVGVIEVSGPNVFSGYWNMPEKTAEEFREDGYFITGDLAKVDAGGYVHIVGRSKDLIISGGYNIYPKEVELVLDEQDGVMESAVVGVPHPDFGEGVVAVIVPTVEDLDTGNVLETIRPLMARFKQPKLLHVMEELPRNTMGKVQKNVLRELLKDTFKS